MLGVGILKGPLQKPRKDRDVLEVQRTSSVLVFLKLGQCWILVWEFELPFGATWWHYGASPWTFGKGELRKSCWPENSPTLKKKMKAKVELP